MPNPFIRLKEWFSGLSPARKWIYPSVAVLVLGGITVGLVLLLSAPTEAGRLVPEGIEIVEVKLPSPVRITSGEGNDYSPTVSPDGSLVVFASDRSGNLDLYAVPAAGGELQQLTHSTADEKNPHYSPDGSSLAYTSEAEGDFDVWVMDARGGGELRLTQHEGDEAEPRWSPIQFQSDTLYYRVLYSSEEGVFTVREDGSDRQSVNLPAEEVSH
ncbi:PD40 domain-containing protein, partial [bacterium]|nr:PD40 domain-containing protein [bacterium]